MTDQVEQALADDRLDWRPERTLDPVSLGALIVSAASLGWTIYRDLKKDRATAGRDQARDAERLSALLREERIEAARLPPNLTPGQHEIIITSVAAEIVGEDVSQ